MIVEVYAIFGRDTVDRWEDGDFDMQCMWSMNVEKPPRPLGAKWAYCFTARSCEIPYYPWQWQYRSNRSWRNDVG